MTNSPPVGNALIGRFSKIREAVSEHEGGTIQHAMIVAEKYFSPLLPVPRKALGTVREAGDRIAQVSKTNTAIKNRLGKKRCKCSNTHSSVHRV